MPQPKSSSARPRRKRAAGPARGDENTTRGIASLRDLLARAVMLPTDLVREALDDAARRGRITRADAEELVDRFMELGRQQTDDVLARIEALIPGGAAVTRAMRTLDRKRGGTGTFPIDGYDELTAAQITGRLGELEPAELRQIGEYEKKNANRKSVLAALDKRLA
jgi:hypothetical protein